MGASQEGTFRELDQKRIDEIEKMLPEGPAGFGKPYQDRAFWGNPKTLARIGKVVPTAEGLLKKEFPAWSDELYLEFSKCGKRPPGEAMMSTRSNWLSPLVLAECVENKGRFLPTINKILAEFVKEPTWVMPAHDRDLKNFHRTAYSIDLRSSTFAASLAEALYLLGDKVDPAVRRSVMDAIEQRVFSPLQATLETGKGHGWLGSKSSPVQNNWNAVCLGGAVGAARTILPDRHRRAVFVAAAEHYSIYYINSFKDDGYCDEGPGYWNYGFGSYVDLREILIDATGGKIDLFANPKIANCAIYGARIQLMDRFVPPFADCRFGSKIGSHLVAYCNQALHLGLSGYPEIASLGGNNLSSQFMTISPLAARNEDGQPAKNPIGNYSFFDKAGVLVCRPDAGSSCRLGVAIKAGGNSSHSHNDVGSFAVALGNEQPVGEPGGPYAYDDKTFGPERYRRKILNSFGHPVPVVGGQLQIDATKAKPVVTKTRFLSETDEITIDMKPSYQVPELIKLERSMRYSRKGAGFVVIEDEVEFSKPMDFEIALPTHGSWKKINPTTIQFASGKEKLTAVIKCAEEFEIIPEIIDEMGNPAFARLGVKLKKPVTKATVTVTLTPS